MEALPYVCMHVPVEMERQRVNKIYFSLSSFPFRFTIFL